MKDPTTAEPKIEEEVAASVAKNAGGAAAGRVMNYLLTYLTVVIATRTLGTAAYGSVALAFNVILLASTIASLGLNEGVIRHVAFCQGRNNLGRATRVLLCGLKLAGASSLALTVVVFLAADFIAVNFFSQPELALPLRIFALGIVPLTLGKNLTSALQALQLIKLKIAVEYISRPVLLLIGVLILVAVFRLGMIGLVGAYLGSFFIGCVVAAAILIKVFPRQSLTEPSSGNAYRNLLGFSLPLLGVGLMTIFIERIDVFVLGYFRPSEQIGIYVAATQVANFVFLPLHAFNLIFLPMVANYHGQETMDKIILLLKTVTKWVISLSLPLLTFLIIFSREMMMIFGDDFLPGQTSLIVLCCGWMFFVMTGPANGLIMMTGYSHINLINSLIIFAVNLVLNIWLVPIHGIMGAAIATAISLFLIGLVTTCEVFWIFKSHAFRTDIYKPLISCAIAAGSVVLVRQGIALDGIPLLARLSSGAIVLGAIYFFTLKLLKFSRDDLIVLRLVKAKLFNMFSH